VIWVVAMVRKERMAQRARKKFDQVRNNFSALAIFRNGAPPSVAQDIETSSM
jgi:hypothetical protein